MSNLKTLVLLSLVAGLTAPVLAADKSDAEQKAAWEAGNVNQLIMNDCATAYPIPFGTTDYTGEGSMLWFTWTGTGSGLTLQTCGGLTDIDTDLRIYTGTCPGTLTQVYYRDGSSACGWATYLNCSEFTFLTGVTYYLRIDEYTNGTVDAGEHVTTTWTDCAPPPPPPANDTAAGATPIYVGDCVTGSNAAPYTDNTGAYADQTHLFCPWVGFYSATSTGLSRDVFYQITVPAGMYTFDMTGSNYDTAIGVWDATGALVAGNDDFTGLVSKIECCTLPAGTYYISVDGFGSATGNYSLCVSACAPVEASDLPSAFSLSQNVPNPFNPTTSINFTMNVTSDASLKVFDLAGREVATLVSGVVEAGQHTVNFDASNLSSGVYFYTLQANGTVETMKMVLMK
jgi:hypothetical protein